ncbi:hypothetical protein ACS0TY_032178 [Phlomoides rotata]
MDIDESVYPRFNRNKHKRDVMYNMIKCMPDQATHMGRLGGAHRWEICKCRRTSCNVLSILGHHEKNRVVKFDHKRSGHTISHYIHLILRSVLQVHNVLLVRPTPVTSEFTNAHWKWFKLYGCLSTLDGTYINVRVPAPDKGRYRISKEQIFTNVLDVCDRELCFVYVLPGWEGSACDAHVLRDFINRVNGLKVLVGKTDAQQAYGINVGPAKNKMGNMRRVWTMRVERAPICALKELVAKGWKSDNGFRTGYLNKLENGVNYVNEESLPIAINEEAANNDDQEANNISRHANNPSPLIATGRKRKSTSDTTIEPMIRMLGDFYNSTGQRLYKIVNRIGYDHDMGTECKLLFEKLGKLLRLSMRDRINISVLIGRKVKNLEIWTTLLDEAMLV